MGALQAFSASDADLIVAAMNDEQFRSLCAVMVLEHLPLLPKFATNPDRVEHRAELIGVLAARFATRTRQEWLGVRERNLCVFVCMRGCVDVCVNLLIVTRGLHAGRYAGAQCRGHRSRPRQHCP